MSSREQARSRPTGSRYWALREELGPVWFRFPSYGDAAGLVQLLQRFAREKDEELEADEGLAYLRSYLAVAGYAIALCWWNLEADLPAELLPVPRPDGFTPEYGNAVVDFLQDLDWTVRDVQAAAVSIATQCGERLSDLVEAEADAGNSDPPKDGSTS